MAANAAAAVASELLAEVEAEGGLANETTPDEPVTEKATEEEAVEPPVDDELPAEIEALLSEEDEEEEDEEEPETPAAEWNEYEVDAGETEKLRVQAHKAEKKAAHLEKQMLKSQRKEWAEEIGKHFRFADPKIAENASSRREALREAKAEHDLALRGAEAVKAHYEKNLEKIVQERVDQELAKVKDAWGTPISGPGAAPAEASERAEVQARIDNATSLKDRLLLKIQAGNLDV